MLRRYLQINNGKIHIIIYTSRVIDRFYFQRLVNLLSELFILKPSKVHNVTKEDFKSLFGFLQIFILFQLNFSKIQIFIFSNHSLISGPFFFMTSSQSRKIPVITYSIKETFNVAWKTQGH